MSTARRLQFSLKHLLAAPVVLAIILGAFGWLGLGWGLFVLITAVAILAGTYGAKTRSEKTAICTIWVMLVIFLPLAIPSPRSGAGRRATCQNNMRQIALALLAYQADHGCFPPPYIADDEGRPMHSWRVLILPYLERIDAYKQYRFDEPWNGPNNRKIGALRFNFFQCPSDIAANGASTATNYLAVVGPGTVWREEKSTSFDDIRDGVSETILLVEVANSGIQWSEPRDLHVNQMAPWINPRAGQGISSGHPGGVILTFADGHSEFIPNTLPPETLRALLSIDGGEQIDHSWWDSQ